MSETPNFGLGRRRAVIAASLIAGALVFGAGGFWLRANRAAPSPASVSESGREVLYWYDPMRPEVHFDAPGQSPFMDMQLVPRYVDEAEQAGVSIDSTVTQNLGVRLASVEEASFARSTRAAGVLAFNERNLAIVQARASGFVERGYGRAVGDVVAAGAPIVDVRVPEWTAAQAEYLALRGGGVELAAAARERLIMLGMPASLIARVERDGAPRPVATITAPIAGAVTALDIRPGMTVTAGAPLATINSVSTIWLIVSLPQADANLAQTGARIVARVSAFPGETFDGRVETVLPAAEAATRTVEVRIALDNRRGRLRPGMTADVEIAEARARRAMLVPAEAVIQTGRRTVVIVALDGGRFAPTEVELGQRDGDRIEITSGLSAGQRIVASGQFLIDSEASLTGALDRLESSAQAQQNAPAAIHEGTGRITALNGANVTIAHGPIASLDWPPMTMAFQLENESAARGLAIGDVVSFRFRQDGSRYVVIDIAKTGTAP